MIEPKTFKRCQERAETDYDFRVLLAELARLQGLECAVLAALYGKLQSGSGP